eukprot:scaffold26213_cov18-Phaeocystis_antarctica.AAC.1
MFLGYTPSPYSLVITPGQGRARGGGATPTQCTGGSAQRTRRRVWLVCDPNPNPNPDPSPNQPQPSFSPSPQPSP